MVRCTDPLPSVRTELLAHPVSRRRFAAIAQALELWAAFPLPGGSFLAPARAVPGSDDSHRDCTAVLHLYQIACIVVPTLVRAC